MIILPAIDIKGGTCVRLYQGDLDTAHKVADNALDTARRFEAAGCKWLHMVDLDGALQGMALNSGIFLEIGKRTNLRIELGGGIRTADQIRHYLNNGIRRVVLGSIAIEDPNFVRRAISNFGPESIAVGIDAKDGYVCGDAWTSKSDIDYIEMAERMAELGVHTFIYTDISRDGTLTGPDLDGLKRLREAMPESELIASGGVHTKEDIRAIKALGIDGVICGKALYEGTLDLEDALAIAKGETHE